MVNDYGEFDGDYEWLIWWWIHGEFDGDYEWLIWWWMTMVNLMVTMNG